MMAELAVAIQQDAVATCFTKLVRAACVEFWTAKGHLYPASDSIGLSDCPEGTTRPSGAERRRSFLEMDIKHGLRFGFGY